MSILDRSIDISVSIKKLREELGDISERSLENMSDTLKVYIDFDGDVIIERNSNLSSEKSICLTSTEARGLLNYLKHITSEEK